MMPVLVALIGIGGVLMVQQQRNARALQQAQIESAARIARGERELRVLEVFAGMITSADADQRRLGLELMEALDVELAGKLASVMTAAGERSATRSTPAGSGEPDTTYPSAATRTALHGEAPGAAPVLPPLPRQRTNPVVYLHIRRESDRSIAVQLASHLVERGYQVAALEHIADRGPRESQLRYFLADGEEEAIGLQGILAGMGTEVTLVYLPGYEGRGADRPHFEIWLAPALDAG